MYGGVIYGRILDTLIPRWWEEVPVQRWITRRSTMILTDSQALTVDYRTAGVGRGARTTAPPRTAPISTRGSPATPPRRAPRSSATPW